MENKCPQCGRECGNIKMYKLTAVMFLVAVTITKTLYLSGCPECLRKQLAKHSLLYFFPCNIFWPFFTLPQVIYYWIKSGKPGPSPLWLEYTESVKQVIEEQAAVQEAAIPKEDLPALDLHQNSRHQNGAVYRAGGGEFGLRPAGMLLIWALAVIPVVSYGYAWATYTLTDLYLRMIIPAVWVLAHGFIIRQIAVRSGCHSPDGLRIAAVLLGLWNLYCAWVCWICIMSQHDALIFDPVHIWNIIKHLAEQGMWGLAEGQVFSPAEHFAVWALEAVLFIATPLVMVWNAVSQVPICSLCRKKLQLFHQLRQRNPPDNPVLFKKSLRHGDLAELAALPERAFADYLVIQILHCPDCGGVYLLKITYCIDNVKNGKVRTSCRPFMPMVYVEASEIAKLGKP